jgi:arylformamidase
MTDTSRKSDRSDQPNRSDMPAMTRRAIVAGALVAGAGGAIAQQTSPTPTPAAAPAAPPVKAKGPPVWLDMDQAQLDAAYDQSVYAPNQRQVTGRYATNSDLVRSWIGKPERRAYGKAEVEGLDIYRTKARNAPILIFIHGGAWRSGLAKDYGYPAETFVSAGVHFVVPDFSPVQDFQGSLMGMADQVRRAVAWTHRNAKSFGGDANRLYIAGHSSGGHLAGVLLTTDWTSMGLPRDAIKGGLCCSGMFDLKPVRLSARSSYVKFTDEMEQALSPQRHLDRIVAPVIVAHGSLETPEFQRQSRDFAARLKGAGKPNQLIVAEGYNHFEIIETLANPHGLLGRAMLTRMGLRKG